MQVRTFIDRPILAGVILSRLALEQFPEIAPPTVRVNANYTGANAATVQKSVVVVLEEAINGVEGMMYMQSTASNTGSANVSIFFRQGTDPDMAMVNVQNRVATVLGRLPRPQFPFQLYEDQHRTRALPYPGRGRRECNRCRLFHAYLA